MRRSGAVPLLFILVIAFGSLAGVLAKDWSPQLGLDLQGGASVVLKAVPTAGGPAITSSERDTALEIIRSRVDALGVAEPEIVGQDNDLIVVNLPGVKDPCRALEVIRSTAELRFRPVLEVGQFVDPNATTTTAPTSSTATTATEGSTGTTGTTTPTSPGTDDGGSTSTSEGAAGVPGLAEGEFAGVLPDAAQTPTSTTATTGSTATTDAEGSTTVTTAAEQSSTITTAAPTETTVQSGDPCSAREGATATSATTATTATTTATTAGEETTTTATTDDGATTTEEGLGLGEGEFAGGLLPVQDPSSTSEPTATTVTPTTVAGETTTTIAGETTTIPAEASIPTFDQPICVFGSGTIEAPTAADQDVATATVILPDKNNQLCYQLGAVPTDGQHTLVGSIVDNPQAGINNGQWLVDMTIKGDSLDLFNQISSNCYSGAPNCPKLSAGSNGQLAIVLDGKVQSAPSINEPTFADGTLQISGSFTEGEARDLALVLQFGALPVTLEAQSFQTVSPTLGRDSLHAGLVAGFIGIALVALYMLVYYRALGFVVILGLGVWSALQYSIISWLGHSSGLALSLSGVTGIIVSVGVTVDSYVVYFERLKDEIKSGKTIRSSVDRGFQRAFRTIITADFSSFIGAALLYVLTVGAVRGFAFFLGLSTILDVIVTYFFTRPLVARLGRSGLFTRGRLFGIARGLGVRDTAGVA